MTSLIYYGLTLIRFYGQRGRSRISIKLDSHTLLALFSCPPLVFGVGLKKSKMFFSPQWFVIQTVHIFIKHIVYYIENGTI